MRRIKICVLTVFLAMILTGCSSFLKDKPPVIRYGKDACQQCKMIISDEKFACAILDIIGGTYKFDDIGCMAAYESTHAVKVKKGWVHDAKTQAWLLASQAQYVHGSGLVTPMGYDVAAFANEEDAESFIKEQAQGALILYEDIAALPVNENEQNEQ